MQGKPVFDVLLDNALMPFTLLFSSLGIQTKNLTFMKITFVILLLAILTLTSQAQNIYSQQNLENSSTENLDKYLAQAKKNKKTGAILSIAGPVAFLSGAFLIAEYMEISLNGESSTNPGEIVGSVLIIGGTVATLVGIPMFAVNSSRLKKIKIALSNRTSMELTPCYFNNSIARTNQYGVTLRLRF